MKKMSGREVGSCTRCLKKLLLNPENGLCINCENDALREEVTRLELRLSQSRREKKRVYDILIEERKKTAGYLA